MIRFTSLPGFTPTYDADGDVTADGSHTYSWDANGNSTSVDGVGLTFDVGDRMVEQNRSGTLTEVIYAPTGQKFALMNGTTLKKTFIALPGNATAIYTSAGLDHYWHTDWLGSARLAASPTRTVLSTVAYVPFGETYAASGTPDLSFTGQNPDTISGDYDFLYREYSNQGRWASPDPAGLAAIDPTAPQSWNRYAYVLNSSTNLIDPLGLFGWVPPGCSVSYPVGGGAGDIVCPVQPWLIYAGASNWMCSWLGFNCSSPSSNAGGGGGGGTSANTSGPANNGRNCTPSPASAGQYVAATAKVTAMTSEFVSGLGPGNLTFGPGSSTLQVMAQSGPVQDVLNSYYMDGQTSGLYTFGGSGTAAAGGNPVAQFVGSFRWSIAPGNGSINLSLTNTTSFRSLTYDKGPQWQRGSVPTPMGNTHQSYNITATCH
jgi:RHS repeat-associated protein